MNTDTTNDVATPAPMPASPRSQHRAMNTNMAAPAALIILASAALTAAIIPALAAIVLTITGQL